jgi:golgi SNAP receptor complex member 2
MNFSLGQISASLAAMHRTMDDYDSMAKREIIKAKQEKAQMYEKWLPRIRKLTLLLVFTRRVQKFRTDYSELRAQFERLKADTAAEVLA